MNNHGSHPDREPIQLEDPSLPGLSILMSPVELSRFVSKYYPNKKVTPGKISYIRYKPGTSCLIAYTSEHSQVPDFYAKVYRSDASEKLGKAEEYLSESPGKIQRGIVCDTRNMALYFFPNDPKLKQLSRMFNPENSNSSLQKFFSRNGVSSPKGIESLKYKPERRFVAKISGEESFSAALKIYSKENFDSAHFNSQAFASKNVLKIPRLLKAFPRKSILIFEWLNGSPLDAQINLTGGEKELQKVGEALAELHLQNPSNLQSILPEEEIKRWTELADGIGHVCPHLLGRAKNLARRMADCLMTFTYEPCSLHGDFYSDQILIHDKQVAILDLDRSFSGDPAFDLGMFQAHLERKVVFRKISSSQRDRYRENLIAGYQRGVNNKDWLSRVDFYTAAGLLRIIPENFRNWVENWPLKTELLLQKAERFLDNQEKESRASKPAEEAASMTTTISDPYQIDLDPKMPFLNLALDPDFISKKLSSVVFPDKKNQRLQMERIHVSRYKPERRCLIQYDFQNHNNAISSEVSVMGKVKARHLDKASFKIQALLWSDQFGSKSKDNIFVPEPIGVIPEIHMWLYRKVPGVPFTDLLNEKNCVSRVRQIAAGIYKLHSSGRLNDRSYSFRDELDILNARLRSLMQRHPDWSGRIDRILDTCARLETDISKSDITGIHRDFYPDQVLIDGKKMFFIDFDMYSVGNPCLDIGNFLGHIKEYALRKHGHPDYFLELENSFEDQYLSLARSNLKNSIKNYLTLTLARHIFISTLFSDRKEFTPDLIEYTEQRLNLSSQVYI